MDAAEHPGQTAPLHGTEEQLLGSVDASPLNRAPGRLSCLSQRIVDVNKSLPSF